MRESLNIRKKFRKYPLVILFSLVISFMTFLTACGSNSVSEGSKSTGSSKKDNIAIAQEKKEKKETKETLQIDGNLKVHFIDVGQADSILITEGNHNMLIDAGNNDDGNLVKNYLKKNGVKDLEYVVGTHPHEDHIGGLDDVINTFSVKKVFMPKKTSTTKTYKDVIMAIKNKGLKITVPKRGTTFNLGNAKCTVVAPIGNKEYKDTNNYSIVIKLEYNNTSFLFTGDAEDISENEILSGGYNIKADVLKVGHHGSRSSTTDAFLRKVSPKYAVISCGKDNEYGHPHKATMDKLSNKNIAVYRTDELGSIVATSNGSKISFNVKKGSYKYNDNSKSSSNSSSNKKYYTNNKSKKQKIAAPSQEKGHGLIKGNINSKGEKIYHVPGGAYYDKTVPEAWFNTEKEARDAGFRKSKR